MGGPKGVREEVLHANHPRHRDNLGSGVFHLIIQARKEQEAKGHVGALMERLGVSKQGVRGNRELGGEVSAGAMYRVNERGPELLQVAGRQYLMMGSQSGKVKSAGNSGHRQTVVHQTIHFDTGGRPVDRRTADQLATAAGMGTRRALARNS